MLRMNWVTNNDLEQPSRSFQFSV